MRRLSSDSAIAVAVIRDRQALDVQSLGTDVLFMWPSNSPEGEIDLSEIVQVFQFMEDFVIKVGPGIEPFDAAVAEA